MDATQGNARFTNSPTIYFHSHEVKNEKKTLACTKAAGRSSPFYLHWRSFSLPLPVENIVRTYGNQ